MNFHGIIGQCPKMKQVYELVDKVSKTDCTVLIQGDSGTGKELIARAIHYRSPKKGKPFFPINCGAIPENLLESELFGHERGSFTGAVATTRGLFEEADEGTVFLDEVGEITPPLQVKLLRVLEGGDFKKIGSNKMIRVNVRVIAATNSDLIMAIKNNSFREDLYYRLNVVPIHLPPLRERVEDIPVLAMHFLKKASEKFKKDVNQIAPEVIQSFTRYSWPGNIRELENLIESATVLANSSTMTLEDFPTLSEKIANNPRKTRLTDLPFYEARDTFEKEYVDKLLSRCEGNISRASKLGKISRKSLRTKAVKYGLMSSTILQT